MNENEKVVTEAKDTATEVKDMETRPVDVAAGVQAQVQAEEEEDVDGEADEGDEEDSKETPGDKEVVVNSEAMAIEESMAKAVENPVPTSFFVKKEDRHKVEADILSSAMTGRIVSVARKGLGLNYAKEFPYLRHQQVWFEFSVPNYEDMSTYRQRSASWKKEAQQTIVDRLQLRNFLLVWHLKDWSLTDSEGNKVALEHEENGALTDDSVAKVYAVSPTLIDVVLTMFEKDILLS